jgi:hypothetical protein
VARALILIQLLCFLVLPPGLTFAEAAMPGERTEAGPATLADNARFRLHPNGVFERSENGGAHWLQVRGLPVRVLPAEMEGIPLPVTAFAVDPSSLRLVYAAVGSRLFMSASAGAGWTELDISEVVNRSTYVTAIAVDPSNPGRIALGTSYDGIYLTTNRGETWRDITADWRVPDLYLGAGFFDEVAAAEFEPDGRLLVQAGPGGGFVSLDLENRLASRLRPVSAGPLAYRAPRGGTTALAWGSRQSPAELPSEVAAERRAVAADRTGIYVSSANASEERLPGYFETIRAEGYNSIVVDFKDDEGRVTYRTELEMPRRIGAAFPIVATDELMQLAAENSVYVIARLVLFKDRRLYAWDNNRYALWDDSRDAPWGVFRSVEDEETGETRAVQVEHWVDPFHPDVVEYNIAIAEEVVALGADEIQFDYVRFPSDGRAEHVVSRYEPDGADRVQALESFLSQARERLSVPISVDVFGFNAWSRMSYLGQDISRIGRYVDVISPMYYPSHFARSFLPEHSYMERSRVIYDEGVRRARMIANRATEVPVLIRPYVQAFLIGGELAMEAPEYHRYLELQVEGSMAADADGYTLWNASGRYYMLR